MTFTTPTNTWTDKTGRKCWVAVCIEGGAVHGATKQHAEKQIEYWTQHKEEWTKWVSRHA